MISMLTSVMHQQLNHHRVCVLCFTSNVVTSRVRIIFINVEIGIIQLYSEGLTIQNQSC